MSLVPLLNAPEPAGTYIRSQLLRQHPNPKTSPSGPKNPAISRRRREASRLCCSNPAKRSPEASSDEISEVRKQPLFRSWDVPWDWKVTACVAMPYLMSIVLTGIVESSGMAGVLQPHSDTLTELQTPDELAIRMFMDQLLKSMAKLSILYMFVSPHQPFPDDIFAIRWGRPFNRENGWILWGVGGLIISSISLLVKAFVSGSWAGQAPNEAESLMRLLPLIGSSNVSTVCLLAILGILAPICEETLYRGFFLTSLTKWFPLPVSLVLSSAVFALSHQSPGKFLEIFVFGITLGLIYARTRNLLTPIAMHSCWNSGVILLLTYLHSQGHDIQKYIL